MPGESHSKGGQATLHRVITLRYAVAMYVSSVLGSGILVIPGLAAQAAGPGSILAWILLSLASYPFAFTFARLSARNPTSGGIYAFARESFGSRVSMVTALLFVAWVVLGAPATTLAAASYLAFSFPLDRPEAFVVAAGILLCAFIINYRGIRLSGRVQLATIGMIMAILVFAIVGSAGRLRSANFVPFLPNGVASVGVAAALIVWSFLGYENVSNVAEEFKDPKRDFDRGVVISVILVSALYLAVAFVTVGTNAYRAGSGVTPFAVMVSSIFGPYGGAIVSVLAVFIIFGTVNAYSAGMARVVYAAAREGDLPRFLGTVDARSGVPRRALSGLYGLIAVSLVVFYVLQVDLETAFIATSGAAVLTYVVGSAAGIRLLKQGGVRKILPWISLAVSLALLPFIGVLLTASLAIVLVGLAYSWGRARRRPERVAD
jgi:amino acid efflux transporter